MSTATTKRDVEAHAADGFARDAADHTLNVLHDDGLYKHLRFQKGTSWHYRYNIVTWPGYLSVSGDMGNYVFSRTEDMLAFFRGRTTPSINPGYWGEKITAAADPIRRWEEDRFLDNVRTHVTDDYLGLEEAEAAALREQVQVEILSAASWGRHDLEEALKDFEFDLENGQKWRFTETYEWDNTDWDYRYLWICHAIVHGVRLYDEHQANHAPEVAHG